MDEQTKNSILAMVLSGLVLLAWFIVFPPEVPPETQVDSPTTSTATAPGLTNAPLPVDPASARDDAVAQSQRITLETPRLTGSIAVRGGRIDDLHLTDYRETLDPTSDTVVLLSPTGTAHPYFATYGWLPTRETPVATPGPDTEWTIEAGDRLTPQTPVTLKWDNGAGLVFRREIAVDNDYMFSVTQSVENTTDTVVSIAPYGYIARVGEPDIIGFFVLHEGVIGAGDGTSSGFLNGYSDLEDLPVVQAERGNVETINVENDGWIGFTDKYWMTTLIPEHGQPFSAVQKHVNVNGTPHYRTEVRLPVVDIPAGTSHSTMTRLFAGAKEVAKIREYQNAFKIDRFDYSVDWGWFYFLTRPMFDLLTWVKSFVGNMGFSIIVLTFLVKAVLFPLAYKSYVSMSRMKKLQPEMEKIKEKVGDDRQALQREMMGLYKKEKVNPASGCLPILLQIPIFFSLYKVFIVTIEMRHAPFIGWIEDLSAPDPTSWMNLFGALPWDSPDPGSIFAILSIGVYPILMGITMWMQQKLNPAPTDATQAMIFAWMPWVFMFMLGTFASGLVIYWCANNILTFAQQYSIMRSQGVDVDFFGNVKRSFRRKNKKSAS